MRRLLSWLVNALCLLSLLACVGTGWLWWHSRSVLADNVTIAARGRLVGCCSERRWLSLTAIRGWPFAGLQVRSGSAESFRAERADETDVFINRQVARKWEWLCFRRYRFTYTLTRKPEPSAAGYLVFKESYLKDWVGPTPGVSGVTISAHHALFVIATALPPLLWLAFPGRRLYTRRRRRRLGLCQRCGYDLRGNTSGKCSECGEKIEAEAEAAERRVPTVRNAD